MQVQNNTNVNFCGEKEIISNLIKAWEKTHKAFQMGEKLTAYPANRTAYLLEVGEVRGLLDAATSDSEISKVIDTFTPQNMQRLQAAQADLETRYPMDLKSRARCFSIFRTELLHKAGENLVTSLQRIPKIFEGLTPKIKSDEKVSPNDLDEFRSLVEFPNCFRTLH